MGWKKMLEKSANRLRNSRTLFFDRANGSINMPKVWEMGENQQCTRWKSMSDTYVAVRFSISLSTIECLLNLFRKPEESPSDHHATVQPGIERLSVHS